ncbi:DUF74-domain-containing protein [Polyplosphaeria fusca]|uniref:DUF74-domain-containing protein n=1 Tax=Polyplosphaeria fusca TaxID=682080 RepID=A0A9P4V608_9PLEO|nr:DUF74-domain-containing protein [Polyplosphaeria fusca]
MSPQFQEASSTPATSTQASRHPSSAFNPEEEPHCFSDTHGVITTTTLELPGYRVVRVLGTVYGLGVRSRNIGSTMLAGLKSYVGGELKPLTTLLYTSRDQAVKRLVNETQMRGGNAIIAMRFESSELMNFVQCCAYGTACVVEEVKEKQV